jgi:hypothetical protein
MHAAATGALIAANVTFLDHGSSGKIAFADAHLPSQALAKASPRGTLPHNGGGVEHAAQAQAAHLRLPIAHKAVPADPTCKVIDQATDGVSIQDHPQTLRDFFERGQTRHAAAAHHSGQVFQLQTDS